MRLLSLCLALILLAAPAARAEAVHFPGKGLDLSGTLVRPRGPGPFPAVVALHGCSGLYDRAGELSARHDDWARRLTAQGYVVLFPDSFGSRGVGPQCKTEDRATRPANERTDDAKAAKAYLQTRPDVKPGSILLLGWSNGGSTVLYAAKAGRGAKDGQPDFAAAAAFYPGCRLPLEKGDWHARVPLLILIGADDDWTPAAPCKDLADQARAANEPVSIVLYPNAYHDFDTPDVAVHEIAGLAYTAKGGGSAHAGTNPAARADAVKRVAAFFADHAP